MIIKNNEFDEENHVIIIIIHMVISEMVEQIFKKYHYKIYPKFILKMK